MALRRFLRNGLNVAALAFIVLTILISLLGYLITPDPTPFANRQIVEIAMKKPGSRVDLMKVKKEGEVEKVGFLRKMIYGQQDAYSYVPLMDGSGQVAIVTKRYLLGTDQFGRDLMSRLMIGTRISLAVGFISVFISLVLGIFIGALGGFFRCWVDKIVMWVINVVWAILEESSWSLPAHQIALTDMSRHHIDLGVAGTAIDLAELDLVLGAQLDPLVGKRIRYEIDQRCFTPYLMRHDW